MISISSRPAPSPNDNARGLTFLLVIVTITGFFVVIVLLRTLFAAFGLRLGLLVELGAVENVFVKM